MHSRLIADGYVQSLADSCLYVKVLEDSGDKVILIVWVDDIAVGARSDKIMSRVKRRLCNEFSMRDLGQISWFLGVQFTFDGNKIVMDQSRYAEQLIDRNGLSDCKPRSTPYELNVSKVSENDGEILDDPLKFRSIVGGLIYLMITTRPDLCFIVTKLSQFMSHPTATHMTMCKHVLRYLKGTKNFSLVFQKSEHPVKLIGYSDADWGSSQDRRSMSGYSFKLSDASSPISWKTKKQATVALSTCEAEYMALAATVQEAKFLSQLLTDMSRDKVHKTLIHVDSQSAISLANNPIQHQRSKHIDIRYHYIRSEIQNNHVDLKYISTEDNVADIFTKPVPAPRLQKFVKQILKT